MLLDGLKSPKGVPLLVSEVRICEKLMYEIKKKKKNKISKILTFGRCCSSAVLECL